MRIIGPDRLVFGVDDLQGCRRFLLDYGLTPVGGHEGDGLYEALDGTGIEIFPKDASHLPPPLPTATMIRKTVYGVEDRKALEEIRAELMKDREVRTLPDGSIESTDDLGFALGFQVTVRRKLNMPAELVNSPGAEPLRPVNQLGVNGNAEARPRTLSHVVFFVPDVAKIESFYINRLNFVITDRFVGAGPFLRPSGTLDHHTLFLIQTPDYMKGVEHLAFHMQGPTELLLAGTRLTNKGYKSFWGPGRHKFGSNWFWYFNSPLGTHFEYDADMDLHDENWTARELPFQPEHSQLFLFEHPRALGSRRRILTRKIADPHLASVVVSEPVCNRSALVEGVCYGFDPLRKGRDTVILLLRGDQLLAYLDICPHYGRTSLAWRKDAYLSGDGKHFFCSAHGALFDVETGLCVLGPCLGRSLESVEVVTDEAGDVRLRTPGSS